MSNLKDVQRLTLDFSGVISNKSISVKQGDVKSRFIEITPILNNQNLTLSADEKVEFRCIKPDKKTASYSVEYTDSKIIVELKEQVLAVAGTATTDIVILGVDGEILSSATFYIYIIPAASNGNYLPSEDYYKRQSDIDMNGHTLKNVAMPIQDSDVATKEYVDKNKQPLDAVANALKGNLSGEIITINDVSPIEHKMTVKVKGKNLIPYPYKTQSTTISGVTFTDNGDGTITVSGTATEEVIYSPIDTSTAFLLSAGTYVLSGGLSSLVYLQGKVLEDDTISIVDSGNGKSFTVTEAMHCRFNIRITSGTTVNDTIKPQLEIGTVATEYAPYIDPSTVKLKNCGKNIFDGEWESGSINTTTGAKQANSTSIRTVNYIPVKPNTTYYFSFTAGVNYFPYSYDKDFTFIAYKSMKQGSFYLTMGENEYYLIIVQYGNTTPPLNAQIEIGAAATEYEEFKGITEYTPTTDGTVENVISVYPTMLLFTDTANTIIECEYNKDTNKVIESLVNAIISLGGNV